METEPHLEALTQHVTGRLAIPGASAGAEVKVLTGSGSGILAMSQELIEVPLGHLGMTQTVLMQSFAGQCCGDVVGPGV